MKSMSTDRCRFSMNLLGNVSDVMISNQRCGRVRYCTVQYYMSRDRRAATLRERARQNGLRDRGNRQDRHEHLEDDGSLAFCNLCAVSRQVKTCNHAGVKEAS